MRNLRDCRRGSVAFGVLAAAIPLIGVLALGTEAGSWYVYKSVAQNAADAAAIAGALSIANTGSIPNPPIVPQNGSLNQVDVKQLPSQQAKAVVTIPVKQFLTKILYTYKDGTIPITASATAQVNVITKPCILALNGPISFQGSPVVNAQGCGFLSDSSASNAISFTGSAATINATVSAAGGCSQNGNSNNCTKALTYGIQVPDPLSRLDTALSNLAINATNFPGGSCAIGGPVAYSTTASATQCYNGTLPSGKGNGNGNSGGYSFPSPATLSGTYFFAGPVTIGSNATISGTATLILLPGASLNISGTASIHLIGQASVASTSVPSVLNSPPILDKMSGLLIYDPETTTGNGTNSTVNITGNSSSYFNGVVYAPRAAVTYTGSSDTSTGTGCNEVIASAIAYAGNTSYLNNGTCPSQLMSSLADQYVSLVQ